MSERPFRLSRPIRLFVGDAIVIDQWECVITHFSMTQDTGGCDLMIAAVDRARLLRAAGDAPPLANKGSS